ncbi:MAG: PD-(D/E)XK nuclease family protein [Bacteroidales bacterium]|nr:PD-(D/E)XK nuclease family protein [Bacteroidales bacterium]
MQAFLYETAKEILCKYKLDIHSYCFVFPNKRTNFFFRKYYSELYGASHKAPKMLEIRRLIHQFTKLTDVDDLAVIFKLYKIFKKTDIDSKHNFDQFYKLGEIILSDFNEIDSWLTDPIQIFKNITDIKEIETHFDWLTEEQKDVLKKFWINFAVDEKSKEKKMFLELWNILPNVYKELKEYLLKRKIAYTGLLYRVLSDLIDQDKLNTNQYIKYIFIGFNALNSAELKLFKHLDKEGQAEFYWDTDKYYHLDNKQEAGDFLRKNFSALNISTKNIPENFLKSKEINLTGVSLNLGQAKILPEILKKIRNEEISDRTAIILADEHMLFPVINSLPEYVDLINVTMGYPMKLTPVFQFIKLYSDLHVQSNKNKSNTYYYKYVINLLKHPYVAENDKELNEKVINEINKNNSVYIPANLFSNKKNNFYKLLFLKIPDKDASITFLQTLLNLLFIIFDKTKDEEGNTVKNLKNEYIHRAYTKTKRLKELLLENDVETGLKLTADILMQIMRTDQISFEGDAVEGLQLMGLMESRNLDFKNIILLGFNEGNIPSVSKKPTFLSQSIRYAFEMPVIKHQDSVYAYLFYRLLQKAENINLVYNNIVNESNSGEVSRFAFQLLYESGLKINHIQYNEKLFPVEPNEISVKKTPEVLKKLDKFTSESTNAFKKISPAALNTYLDCSLKFYMKYVAEIKESKEVEEEFSSATFGSLLHLILENVYTELKTKKGNSIVKPEDFELIFVSLPEIIELSYNKYYKNQTIKTIGSQIIIKEVLLRYVTSVLKTDKEYAPFEIISLEADDDFSTQIEIEVDKQIKQVLLNGIIDRIDKKNNIYRVIDYKTGQPNNKFASVESLFNSELKKRSSHVFQTFFYTYLFIKSKKDDKINVKPGIYYTRSMNKSSYDESVKMKIAHNKDITIDEIELIKIIPEFINEIKKLLIEIFSSEYSFVQTDNTDICKYCSYNMICSK